MTDLDPDEHWLNEAPPPEKPTEHATDPEPTARTGRGHFTDPWTETISGPWRDSLMRSATPCHYGCGHLAYMTEPGRRWKAHKACAQGTAADEIIVRPHPADTVHASAIPNRDLGCGNQESPLTNGRRCAATGTQRVCMLCPNSPTYWRNGN